jgi:DNA polymerase-3 subunit gamma/tau
LTRVTIAPEIADSPTVPEAERVRGRRLAESLPMPALTRAWQMLLKGLGEVRVAPAPLQAAEMLLVRLAYAAELPTPADLVRELREGGAQPATPEVKAPREKAPESSAPAPTPPPPHGGNGGATQASAGGGAAVAQSRPAPGEAPDSSAAPLAKAEHPMPQGFVEMVALFEHKREGVLHANLCRNVRLVRFEPGKVELNPDARAPRNLANRVGQLLGEWTGERWVVSISGEPGEPTLAEQADAATNRDREEAARHPLVRAARKAFPDARITRVAPAPGAGGATPGDGDDR